MGKRLETKRMLFGLACMALLCGASDGPAAVPKWSDAAVLQLRHAVDAAPQQALPRLETSDLDAAVRAGDAAGIDKAATALALKLARMHLQGCYTPAEHAGWSIPDSDTAINLAERLDRALQDGHIDSFFTALDPLHPDYTALIRAYAAETDPAKRLVLARNLERWRWLPQSLGSDYILVNTASFEVRTWHQGKQAGTWRVIVGKTKSPTPVFAATVTGVTLNPWWDIPANIVRESVGALVRRNPHLAAQRGYVWGGGRYRQRPGPGNSLGQMKLAMPNPYNVYLHDTPSRELFKRDVRAFSHGCIRVENALGFAASMLDGVKSRAEIDVLVAAGNTVTVSLARPMPVYITYFTAGVQGDGSVALYPDIYGRDGRMGDSTNPHRHCPA